MANEKFDRVILYTLLGGIIGVIFGCYIICKPKPPYIPVPYSWENKLIPPHSIDDIQKVYIPLASNDPHITLKVIASELFENALNYQEDFVLSKSVIRDNKNPNPAAGGAITNFKTDVHLNRPVLWWIEKDENNDPYHEEYDVQLVQIVRKDSDDNPDYFDENYIVKGNTDFIRGWVDSDKDLENKEFKYTIWFSIKNDNGEIKFFSVDPILKAKPS